ncbi:MAG: sulfur carrier protein ThiS [Syntrophomonadaceae bacterium]|nr:sulfur carrier protein ThiS [Syntrophomonadaceae bacterium]
MRVNGDWVRLDREQTLLSYLQSQNLNIDTIAVELNGDIILKETYAKTRLNDEDVLEIVHFVGGG